MPKTDDIIKEELSSIGDYKGLKRRGFIGSSNFDQELWVNGGLTFTYLGKDCGSNDFAWYREEKWVDPESKQTCNYKPIIVIEGTHCLNTGSYGTAQLQRFHHAYGPFRNGIISIYYLKEGKHEIRHDLLAAAYYANITYDYLNRKTCYIVTDKLSHIETLVHLVGDYGEKSDEVWRYIQHLVEGMKVQFHKYYDRHEYKNFEEYLNERCVFKETNGNWIKYLGPKIESFLDSSIRYGHIVLGEAFVANYMLRGSKLLSPDKTLDYFFPLIDKKGLEKLTTTLKHDKEFLILSGNQDWRILTIDDVEFDDKSLKDKILPFRKKNLNDNRKEWNVVRKQIEYALKNNLFTIVQK